jgi:hypothetical protein
LVENKDYTYQENEDQFSMLIFRDDDQNEGGSKFIVKADMDVKGLITMLKKYYEIEDESMRRIRDLSNQRLFTKEDLTVTLRRRSAARERRANAWSWSASDSSEGPYQTAGASAAESSSI